MNWLAKSYNCEGTVELLGLHETIGRRKFKGKITNG